MVDVSHETVACDGATLDCFAGEARGVVVTKKQGHESVLACELQDVGMELVLTRASENDLDVSVSEVGPATGALSPLLLVVVTTRHLQCFGVDGGDVMEMLLVGGRRSSPSNGF